MYVGVLVVMGHFIPFSFNCQVESVSHLIQTSLRMDLDSRIEDIQKCSSEAISRMRKSICTSSNVDESSDPVIDVVNMPTSMNTTPSSGSLS
jgi:predicted nucleotidyltransferase